MRQSVSLDAAGVYRTRSGLSRNGPAMNHEQPDETGNLLAVYRDLLAVIELPPNGRA